MKVLCTFPGKYGDLLWALPTVRAISRRVGAPVDLAVADAYASICSLIGVQPYVGRCFPLHSWRTQETAPISPRIPVIVRENMYYDLIFNLGYREWPTPDCVRHTWQTFVLSAAADGRAEWTGLHESELALDEPWITAGAATGFYPWPSYATFRIAVGFTDEHFELKYGLTRLIDYGPTLWYPRVIGSSPRWASEAVEGQLSWSETLTALQRSNCFLGDCSALHVLAVAVGTPVVLVEPAEARWNPVFYPLGDTGPRVTLVRGNDGRPTVDARHVAEAVERVERYTSR